MSDFLYHSKVQQQGRQAQCLRDIYHADPPETTEFHGDWGSLAVSRNPYYGFEPHETDSHLFVIVGGPVLTFRDNLFLTGDDPAAGSVSIFERYASGGISWDEDVSGPFAVLIVDKQEHTVRCVTDMMLFIPVYEFAGSDEAALSTHPDALAHATDQQDATDTVSMIDFVLNNVVTYPFTMYSGIRQCLPAAVHEYRPGVGTKARPEPHLYWEPFDTQQFRTIGEAADALRQEVTGWIRRITEGMDHVGMFVSGGEDSRVVAGLLPHSLKKDGFVFLDSMNREGRIAKKVAQAHGIDLHVSLRETTHYLKLMPRACDLMGSGQQCIHAHTLGFHKSCGLDRYPAVFGGFLANSLLKAGGMRKLRFQRKMPFLPDVEIKGEGHSRPLRSNLFNRKALEEIDRRRRDHVALTSQYRTESLHQWFQFWPRSMGFANANIAVNRRLFRSYEPFTCSGVIKISAGVPNAWKRNNRLYNMAFRGAQKSTKWVTHSKGAYPYFPYWVNIPFQFRYWLWEKIRNRLGIRRQYEGPWIDWAGLMVTEEWKSRIDKCDKEFLQRTFNGYIDDPSAAAAEKDWKIGVMINLIQTHYFENRKEYVK